MKILIRSGHLFDPVQGWHDRVGDLGIADGRLVRTADLGAPDRVLEAEGLVVTAAAIDPAAWVAPPEAIQLMRRFGFPSLVEIGLRYAEKGYCHVHHPFLTPLTGLSVRRQLEQLPLIDSSVSLAIPLYDLEPWLAEDRHEEAAEHIGRLLALLGTRGLYLAEPALEYPLDVYRHRNRGSEQILPFFGEIARSLDQPLLIPASVLAPADWRKLPATTHIQRLSEAVAPAVEAIDSAAAPTTDLGLPWPGAVVTPCWRHQNGQEPGLSVDHGFSEQLAWTRPKGFDFRRDAELAARLQSFQPENLALTAAAANLTLIDDWTGFLEAVLEAFPLDRFLALTRATPARILAMPDRGHLKWGARADLACYPKPNEQSPRSWAEALSRCHTLILDGQCVIEAQRRLKPGRPGRVWSAPTTSTDRQPPDFLDAGLSLRPETLLRLRSAAQYRGEA
jgi:hypothetical protein